MVILAFAVGTTLRLWNLRAQVMGGDELHAVRAAVQRPLSGILFVYQESDNCIPLTLFDRLLMDAGVPLGEMLVRLPVLVAGLAMLVVGPWWAWRRLGAGPAVAFAWLLAISPALVFYSRIARSYGPAALLGCAAVVAFEAWERRGGRRLAGTYVAGATAAVWFHLAAAPLVLAPLLAGVPRAVRARGRRAAALLALVLVTSAALFALLAPARDTLLPLIAQKSGSLAVTAGEIAELAAWLAGVRSPWLATAFWALVVIGAIRLAGRDARLAGFLVVAGLGQVLGILALAPQGHQNAVILARYLVPALPIVLAFVAEALGRPWLPGRAVAGVEPGGPWSAKGPAVQACLVAAVVVGLVAAGPFVDPALARSSFAHSVAAVRFTAPRQQLPREGLPPVYVWLARAAPGPVVELPWHPVWRFDRAYELYQERHRRQVVVTIPGGAFADTRLVFRNMARGDPEGLLASRGRWLIVHRSLPTEEARLGRVVLDARIRAQLREHGAHAVRQLRAAWGRPDHRDEWTLCWDLDRVRRQSRR
jgi:hypothetical protein